MAEETNGKTVGYSVKELLSTLNEKVDRIENKLDNKVDKSELEVIHNKIAILEGKILMTEAVKEQADKIGQIYLRQWEAMQITVNAHTVSLSNIAAVATKVSDWRILWVPIIANSIGLAVLIYFTLR